MINKSTPLVKGMIISDDHFSNRHFKIIKIGRKYATITPDPGLPGIDEPEKVLFTRIYDGCSEVEYTKVPPAECLRSNERKEIVFESASGMQSIIDIAKDRDPENYIKHNAPSFRYIKTV